MATEYGFYFYNSKKVHELIENTKFMNIKTLERNRSFAKLLSSSGTTNLYRVNIYKFIKEKDFLVNQLTKYIRQFIEGKQTYDAKRMQTVIS